MKAITILQPYASLIACGAKKIETRSWATKYRGPIAIHAGKSLPTTEQWAFNNVLCQEMNKNFNVYNPRFMILGCVIAIADLVDCVKMVSVTTQIVTGNIVSATLANGQIVTGNELAFGDYGTGRYAWILANVRQIKPVPARGMQRIWNWEGEQP